MLLLICGSHNSTGPDTILKVLLTSPADKQAKAGNTYAESSSFDVMNYEHRVGGL